MFIAIVENPFWFLGLFLALSVIIIADSAAFVKLIPY